MLAQKPSCVVLGGSGFIGTNLCRRLFRSGHRVRAFGRDCRFARDLGGGVEWYQGDFNDPDSVAAAIEDFDIVFHLVHGAMPQAANLAMATDVQQNIVPSIALLDLCSKLGVKRVIFSSSGGTVYGCSQQIPTPETASTNPICAYGINKLAIEKYLALYEHLHSLNFRVLRIANPYGPFQLPWRGQGFIAAAISRALTSQPIEIWGDGSVIRDFVFIDDVVDAFEAAMTDTSNTRIFNVGTSEGRSLCDVIGAIEQLLDVKLNVTWARGRSIDIPVSVLAIDRALEVLHWKPKTTFESGLATTVEWTRQKWSEIDELYRRST
jgi:UDP-glucose 4-epimerase